MWEAMSFFSFFSSFLSCHPLSRTCPAGWSSLLQVRWVSIPARNQNQANMGARNMKRFHTHREQTLHPATCLGKLEYFTNLNSSAIKGDDFPKINHDSRVWENSEVVIIYPDYYSSL